MKQHDHEGVYVKNAAVIACAGCRALVCRGYNVVTTQFGAKVREYCGRCKPPYSRIETHDFDGYAFNGMVERATPRYFKEFEVDEHGKLIT